MIETKTEYVIRCREKGCTMRFESRETLKGALDEAEDHLNDDNYGHEVVITPVTVVTREF